jgi:hypothetical protein
MSILYTFPFCVISDFGTSKKVAGTLTVTESVFNTKNEITFVLDAKTWNTQSPDLSINIEMSDLLLYDSELIFDFVCTLDADDCLVLIFDPQLEHTQSLDASIRTVSQQIVDTDYVKTDMWLNLPVKPAHTTRAKIRTHVQETKRTVVGHLADSITFRKTLTHILPSTIKPGMGIEQNIEYFLGKDRLKNLYFNSTIPAAWTIPARVHNLSPVINSNTVGFFSGDTIEYYYNNLGYRSTFDYVLDELLEKRIILCLGDSDSFGVGVDYANIWPNLIDTDAIVLNLSIPGISLDGITRIATQTIQALGNNIDTVLIHYPPMSLREVVSKKYKGGVHTHRNYNLPYADWWDHIDWQSNNYNFNKNRLLLENVSARYNIEFYDLYINRADAKVPYDFVEYGVYSSIGPHTHRAIANYFNRKINNQPSFFESTQS